MSHELSDKKLAVLGAGKLGGILLRAYLEQGLFDASRTIATVKHAERVAALAGELGILVTNDNREAVKRCRRHSADGKAPNCGGGVEGDRPGN